MKEEDEMNNMNDMKNTTAEANDNYFLEEQELWENLGFDWEGWNATVEKILKQQSTTNQVRQEQSA